MILSLLPLFEWQHTNRGPDSAKKNVDCVEIVLLER